jgi:hypothetical protein
LSFLGFACGAFGFALVLREVGGGDLDGVKDESGAATIDIIEGEAGGDADDCLLDLGAGAELWEREGVASCLPALRVGDGTASVVMVVAEVFVAQSEAAAAVSVEEDVAAAEVLGGVSGWVVGGVGIGSDFGVHGGLR